MSHDAIVILYVSSAVIGVLSAAATSKWWHGVLVSSGAVLVINIARFAL